MKKLLVLWLSLLASATFVHATITIDLGGGNLYTTNTSTFAPTGCLVQLIVSTTDTVFTAPNSGSFTGGSADDFVLAELQPKRDLDRARIVRKGGQFCTSLPFPISLLAIPSS